MKILKYLISFFFLVLYILFLLTAVSVSASEITPTNIQKLINQERTRQGITALKVNSQLTSSAKAKADDMSTNNYFAHRSPRGVTTKDVITKSGYKFKDAGEDLACGFETAEDTVKALMESPTHRYHILKSNYRDVGIAVKGEYVVIHFGKK